MGPAGQRGLGDAVRAGRGAQASGGRSAGLRRRERARGRWEAWAACGEGEGRGPSWAEVRGRGNWAGAWDQARAERERSRPRAGLVWGFAGPRKRVGLGEQELAMGCVLGWVKFLGFGLVRGGFQVWGLFFYLYSICYFKHHSN